MRMKVAFVLLFQMMFGFGIAQETVQREEGSTLSVGIEIKHYENTASIKFEEITKEEYICRIYNLENKLLMKLVKEVEKSTLLIPLDHFRSGDYLLSIRSSSKEQVYKFTK